MEQPGILSTLEAATYDSASPLHFTPVRLRARADGWTEQRQRRFVAALAALGRADLAAAHVGMTEQTARRLSLRPDGASFAAACEAAYTFAKTARRARMAEARQGSEGSGEFVLPIQFGQLANLPPSRPRIAKLFVESALAGRRVAQRTCPTSRDSLA